MKTAIKICLFSLLLAAFSFQAEAQRKPFYTTQEEVVEAAYKSLDQRMESGSLEEWIEGNLEKATGETELSGTFVYDLTIRKKGEVASVFKVESDAPIKVQNYVKDYMKALKFPFKMPKNKSYKFRYEFNF
ncbi:MAG: hypothetical protein RIC95_01530 [Vicingaceae bacterium]